MSVLQINLFRPSPSATVNQPFQFSVNIFSPFALEGGPEFFFVNRGPGPVPAALLHSTFLSYYCYKYTWSSLSGQLENDTDVESS